jgi:hypothetical protein
MAAPAPRTTRARTAWRPTWSTRARLAIPLLALAVAVPSSAAPQVDGGRYPGAEDVRFPGQKDAGTAVALSVAGTLVPMIATIRGQSWAFGAAGVAFGPGLGYAYLGDWGRVASQSALRTGVMAATVGLAAAVCSTGCDIVFGDDDGGAALAGIVLVAGTVITAELARRDITSLPDRVEAHNARVIAEHQARTDRERVRVRMSPTVDPVGRSVGVIVSVR